MEKKKITFNYQRSGVITLNSLANVLFTISVLAGITALLSIIVFIVFKDSYGSADAETAASALMVFTVASASIISTLSFGAICKGLSSIARTALYKRAILEQEYVFVFKE